MVRYSNPPVLTMAVMPTDLSEDLQRLWDLDQVPQAPSHSKEDEQVIKDFNKSYKRINGRFSVSLQILNIRFQLNHINHYVS